MLSFLLYSISSSFGLLIVATFIFSLAEAFRTGTHKAMKFDYLNVSACGGYYRAVKDCLQPVLAGLVVGLPVWTDLDQNLRLPAGIAWFSEQTDPAILATTLSTESQSKTLITALMAMLLGFSADQWGPGIKLLVTSGIMMIGTPPILLRRGSYEIQNSR